MSPSLNWLGIGLNKNIGGFMRKFALLILILSCLSVSAFAESDSQLLDQLNQIADDLTVSIQEAQENYVPQSDNDSMSDIEQVQPGQLDQVEFAPPVLSAPAPQVQSYPETVEETPVTKSAPMLMKSPLKSLGTAPVEADPEPVELEDITSESVSFLHRVADLLTTPPYIYFVGLALLTSLIFIIKSRLL